MNKTVASQLREPRFGSHAAVLNLEQFRSVYVAPDHSAVRTRTCLAICMLRVFAHLLHRGLMLFEEVEVVLLIEQVC